MPLQNRQCKKCNHREDDLLEPIQTPAVIECPICHGLSYEKQWVCSTFKILGDY
jgi:hypothetical protein